MNEENADGEIHALDNNWAYALTLFEPDNNYDIQQIHEHQTSLAIKYADYLLEFDPQFVMSILLDYIMPSRLGITDEKHQFIYRHPHQISMLAQKASIAIKFERSKSDNLEIQ
jgi:hypothetical protein